MLVGRMVRYQVKDNFQLPAMRLLEKLVKILHGPKSLIDCGIIGNVIPKVGHGRWIYWRYPDGVYSQPLQVIQFSGNPRKVADTVIVGVHKRTWVDLINDAGFPPRSICSCSHNKY